MAEELLVMEKVKVTKAEWIARPFVPEAIRDDLARADVLFVPQEGFRERELPLFPVGTRELFEFIRNAGKGKLVVDVAIAEGDFKELALHDAGITIATMVVSAFVLPLLANLVTEYIKKRTLDHGSNGNVRCSMIVTRGGDGSEATKISYDGPADQFGEQLAKVVEAIHKEEDHAGGEKAEIEVPRVKLRVDVEPEPEDPPVSPGSQAAKAEAKK